MTEAFKFVVDRIHQIADMLDSNAFRFEFFGFSVSLWSILVSAIIIGMVASVWWKGARG